MAASTWSTVTGFGRQAAELTERAAGLVEPAERQQGLDQGLERQNRIARVAPLASTAERRDFRGGLVVAGRPFGSPDVDQRRGGGAASSADNRASRRFARPSDRDLRILHSGYIEQRMAVKQKLARNLRLARFVRRKMPAPPPRR